MSGLDQSRKSSVTTENSRKQLGIRAALVLAAASASFAMAGAAEAQDCVNGYRMVKDQVPVTCSEGPLIGSVPNTHPMAARSLYTGSIHTGEQPPAVATHDVSNDTAQCVGGLRWIVTPNNGVTLPMPCS